MEKPATIKQNYAKPDPVAVLDGFNDLDREGLDEFIKQYAWQWIWTTSLSASSILKMRRNVCPTITEIRMIDTYWSDHCRHTTFGTIIEDVDIQPDYIRGNL